MKKLLPIFCFIAFSLFFNIEKISAQSGTCILKQQNTTYEIETPFYWYTVIKESLFSDTLQNTITYSHTNELIETKDNCLSVNQSSPTYEQPLYNNYLNNRTTTFYFNKHLLTDSKSIYEESTKIFNIPDMLTTTNLAITSTYISFDNLPPTIVKDTIESIIITKVNEKISLESIKDKITAYDEVDGIVEVKIHEDNYSNNYQKLGTYNIIFSATDNSGNTAKLTLQIKVIDSIPPKITGQKEQNSYMSNPLTIDQIKSTLTISDNYDKNLKTLEIIENNYSNNITNEGTFNISFITYDNSNNGSIPFLVQITMIDDLPPTISGSASYTVNVNTLLSIETIKKQLTIKDNVDKSPAIELKSDTYSDNYFKVGIYQISFCALDKYQNKSTPFIINIIVQDTDKPIFYISQKFISVDSSTQIPIEELIELITEINNIDNNTIKNLNIIENSYSENYSKEGVYSIKMEYENDTSNKVILESNIVVTNYKEDTTTKKTPKNNFWSTLKNFFIKIYSFFKKLFYKLKNLI